MSVHALEMFICRLQYNSFEELLHCHVAAQSWKVAGSIKFGIFKAAHKLYDLPTLVSKDV